MEFFAWWPAEFLIVGQMCLGLVLLLVLGFAEAPAERVAAPEVEAPNVLPMRKHAAPELPERLAA